MNLLSVLTKTAYQLKWISFSCFFRCNIWLLKGSKKPFILFFLIEYSLSVHLSGTKHPMIDISFLSYLSSKTVQFSIDKKSSFIFLVFMMNNSQSVWEIVSDYSIISIVKKLLKNSI
jgi:hypothetical protein